jgi:hypothetical protein
VGERIVLADFVVDTRGIVQGMRASDDAMARSRAATRAMGSTADAAAAKLFSLRSAALKLAGAFGFVGVAFAAANAVATLTKDLISSTTWFKNAASAVSDWYQEVVKGADALDRLSSKVRGSQAIGALSELRALMGQRSTAEATIARGPNATLTQASGTMSARGLMMPSFTTRPDPSAAVGVKGAAAEIADIDRKANALIATLTRMDMSLEEIERATGATFKAVLGPSLDEIDKAEKDRMDWLKGQLNQFMADRERAVLAATKKIADEIKKLHEIDLPEGGNLLQDLDIQHVQLTRQNEELAKWNQFMIDIYNSTLLAAAAFGKFGEVVTAPTMKEAFKAMSEGVSKINMAVEVAGAAIGTFVSGLSNALISGSFSGKKFFGEMLASLVPVLLGYGALGLVRGFTGDPTGFAAAKIAFPAAIAAAAAARHLGAGSVGSQSSGGGGGSGASLAAAAGSSAGPSVTVVIQGSVIGLGMSRDEFARSIAEDIERARSDGGR